MKRREFLLSGVIVLATSGWATASQSEDEIAVRLHNEGFRITERKRTWLGRIKIRARKGKKLREVVLDPTSGEVLRDYTEDLNTSKARSERWSNRRDDDKREARAEGTTRDTAGSGGASDGDGRDGGGNTGNSDSGGKETGGSDTGGKETSGGETGGSETGGSETGGNETTNTEAREPKRGKKKNGDKKESGDVQN